MVGKKEGFSRPDFKCLYISMEICVFTIYLGALQQPLMGGTGNQVDIKHANSPEWAGEHFSFFAKHLLLEPMPCMRQGLVQF